jgi:anthranilate phosphoribosyltransferase
MKETLQYLFDGNRLSREQARQSLMEVGKGQHSESEFASFLTVFKMRPITSEELAGFRDAMFELSMKVDLASHEAIDVVGTGGDGKNTFNISTLACFVIAGAGVKVTKHGNYAVSSKSGSSNVLELLGYQFSNDIEKLHADLEKGGFCFLHAPLFHPAMKHIAPVRRALKVPTFFNILGPMINPSAPKYQLIGVNNSENFDHYQHVYETLDINFAIVNSRDGYDEVSLTDDTRVGLKSGEKIIAPADFNMQRIDPQKLFGGHSVEEAAKIFMAVLEGNGTHEQNNVVLANAALGLQLVFPSKSLVECVAMARESLESGKALKSLKSVTQ